MDARQTAEQRLATIRDLLTRIGRAAEAKATRATVDWGDAGDLGAALEHAVYAACALGAINEEEAKRLGFPV